MSMTPNDLDRLADLVAEKVARKIADSPRQAMPEGMIDIHAAAELLGCSVATVERWTKKKIIPSHKLGRLRRYKPSEILGARNEKGGRDE
jgi:excisionase family DNA binding protein